MRVLVESHLGQHFVFPGVVREPHPELPVDLGLVLGLGLAHHSGQILDRADEPGDPIAGHPGAPAPPSITRGAQLRLWPGGLGETEPDPWLQVITDVRTRYLGPERRAGASTYSHPKERHQDVLARSPFSTVESAHWDRTVSRILDEVVGL